MCLAFITLFISATDAPPDLAIPPDSSRGLCCPTVSPTPAYRGGLSTLDVGRAPRQKAMKKFPGKGVKSPIPTCL